MRDSRTIAVETLGPNDDVPAAVDVIAAALRDEPGFASVIPDTQQRAAVMHTFLGLLLRDALPLGNVWVARIGGKIIGTAIWYAPGDYPMTVWRNLRMVPGMLPLVRFGFGTMRGLMQMGENVSSHFPEQPCWYLAALGVAPEHQGAGAGSALMDTVLEEIDRRGEPAYLETSVERNVRFYQRLGFEIREPAIRIAPPPGPTHWTMWRVPQ
ncbi:MAG TPA: GNAT family N-acetyltransferase [Acidobacteriaceae bacterium]|nr:GNAT family N-acetyltransferase [Acidobacteriaceae bacterium]